MNVKNWRKLFFLIAIVTQLYMTVSTYLRNEEFFMTILYFITFLLLVYIYMSAFNKE